MGIKILVKQKNTNQASFLRDQFKEMKYYYETFSLFVKLVIVRCVISLVNSVLKLYQLDVNNAFVYDEYDEEFY